MTIKTRSGLKADLPDNSSGDISPADVRQLADSLAHIFEATPSVINMTTSTPPGSPSDRDAYVVASGGTGLWAGKDDQIAIWDGSISPGEWIFSGNPTPGLSVYDQANGVVNRWTTSLSPSAWEPTSGPGLYTKVELTANEVVSANSAVAWDQTRETNGTAMWSSGNPTQLVAPRRGVYLFGFHGDTAALSSVFFPAVYKTGATFSDATAAQALTRSVNPGGGSGLFDVIGAVLLESGESIEAVAHTTGFTLENNTKSSFWMALLFAA